MCQLLRVAAAAASLLACPACATTTTALTRLEAEDAEDVESAAGGAGLVRQAALPAPERATPPWWQNPFRPAVGDGAALAAWEKTLAASGGWPATAASGPPDPRFRVVLNMRTPPGAAGTSDSQAAVSPAGHWLASSAFWPAPPGAGTPAPAGAEEGTLTGAPEPVEMILARAALAEFGGPAGHPGPPLAHHTPEPGTLTLATLGLFGVGVVRRLRRMCKGEPGA